MSNATAQGYKLKCKSLEAVLNSTHKMEAKLIGYDEAAIDVTAPVAIPLEKLEFQEPSRSQCNLKVYPIIEDPKKIFSPSIRSIRKPPKKIFSPSIRSIRKPQPAVEGRGPQSVASTESNLLGGSSKKPARSRLYEVNFT
ncbi:Endoribonuclease [Actinidia chinensis var. chinensis]|uniref:Endoribonuclease n=1 Tax=Actinidia chinensis var. chinensis TaxID=1590841 RepID=A0A2R6QHN6_ACTCC|nr:Endoribonuclease [Actinidia chinensis var. chinensis]